MPKPAWPPPRTGALPAYLGASLCALISILPLFSVDAGRPAFFSFLPMCFLFVGFLLHALLRRVEELERRVAELSGDDAVASTAPRDPAGPAGTAAS